MKKTNHPRWPEPLLGMAPIRLRPMGWLDDLLPMRPPSLWRDISVQRGLQWSPNLADLSWLFAAYSMLGVELPMPRVQHRTHVSSTRQPVRRRRANARTLLQQKGAKNKNVSIPSWGGAKAVHIAPSEKRERRVDHATRMTPQGRASFSSGALPAFQWKGDGFKSPTTTPGNLQLVKKIVNQETGDTRPKLARSTNQTLDRSRQKKAKKQAPAGVWTLKPSSKIRAPKEAEQIRLQRKVLNPIAPSPQQRIAPKKSSLSPPLKLQIPKEAIQKLSPAGKGKSPQTLSSPAQELASFRTKRQEDVFKTGAKKKNIAEAKTAEERRSTTQQGIDQTEGTRKLRKQNYLISPERTRQLRFSIPEIQETIQPRRVAPQISLSPLPLLQKGVSSQDKANNADKASTTQRKKVPAKGFTPEKIKKLQFSVPEAPLTKTKPRRQLSLSAPKNQRKAEKREDVSQATSPKKRSFSVQKDLRKRAAQIFQREEAYSPKIKKSQTSILSPTQPSKGQIVKKTEATLSAQSVSPQRIDPRVSEAQKTKLKAGTSVSIERHRLQSREQDIQQPSTFSVKQFEIVRTLRSRKEKSLQIVPPIFQKKRVSPLQADSQATKSLQPTQILGNKELPIVRKNVEKREEQVTKIKSSPAEAISDTSGRKRRKPATVTAEKNSTRKIEIQPEVLQQLKKVKEFSFREAPQFSKKRQRLIRELQSGNQMRLGSSLWAIEKEIQIVRKQQEREDISFEKRSFTPKEEQKDSPKKKALSLRRVVWPSRSKSNLLRHFELRQVRSQTKEEEIVQHVPQAIHNFFSAPSTGKPQKRTHSPLLSLQSGTLVFPTPDFAVGDDRKANKSKKTVEATEKKRATKRSFPEAYVAQKSAYRRAFTSTGMSGNLRVSRQQEKDTSQKTRKSKKTRQVPTLVQTSLAWRPAWVETQQEIPSAKPRQKESVQENRKGKRQVPPLISEESKQKKKSVEAGDSAAEKRTKAPRASRDISRRIGRYGGLNRESAVFWTRERLMTVPPVVLQGLKKQDSENSTSNQKNEKPRKKILFSSEVPQTKIKKALVTKISSNSVIQKGKRSPPAPKSVSTSSKRTYSIRELNWKPKRLIFGRSEEQRTRSVKSTSVSSSPVQKSSVRRQSYPVIENWRKPPVFFNPLQTDTAVKKSSLVSPQRELVQAKSLSANIVFQPSPRARKEELQFSPQVSKARRDQVQQERLSEGKKRTTTDQQSTGSAPINKAGSVSKKSGVLRKRAVGYLRPNISISRSFVSSGSIPSNADPIKKTRVNFVGSAAQERQVQFYREAQQQTFLRPEQRPLDIQQIENSSRRKEQHLDTSAERKKTQSRRTASEQVVRLGTKTQYQSQDMQRVKSLSSRVFRAMEQIVGRTKSLSPSLQAERNFLRTATLEGGLSAERILRQENFSESNIAPKKKATSTRSILSPSHNPRHPVLSRAQTRPKNSFLRRDAASEPTIHLGTNINLDPVQAKAEKQPQAEQNIEIIRKKRKISSARKPVAPQVSGLRKEIGIFLRPRKQVVYEEEEVVKKPKGLRPDQVSKNATVFFIDPSGNLLQGEKATKRMQELGYARSESKEEEASVPKIQELPTSYTWEADPKIMEMAVAEVKKQAKKQEKPRKIEKKIQPKRVISEMTEEELFTILTALTTSSPEAQEILREVRSKVEEYFDYERFRKI